MAGPFDYQNSQYAVDPAQLLTTGPFNYKNAANAVDLSQLGPSAYNFLKSGLPYSGASTPAIPPGVAPVPLPDIPPGGSPPPGTTRQTLGVNQGDPAPALPPGATPATPASTVLPTVPPVAPASPPGGAPAVGPNLPPWLTPGSSNALAYLKFHADDAPAPPPGLAAANVPSPGANGLPATLAPSNMALGAAMGGALPTARPELANATPLPPLPSSGPAWGTTSMNPGNMQLAPYDGGGDPSGMSPQQAYLKQVRDIAQSLNPGGAIPIQNRLAAMDQLNKLTEQGQVGVAQQNLAAYQQGQLGIQGRQASVEESKQALDLAKQQYATSLTQQKMSMFQNLVGQGWTPAKAKEQVDLSESLGLFGPGLQAPGVKVGVTPPGAPPGVEDPTKTLQQQKPPWWENVSQLTLDPHGNQLPGGFDIDKALQAVEANAPPGSLSPANVKNYVGLLAQAHPGGMDAIKSAIVPGAFGKSQELLASGVRALGGKDAVSPEAARRAAFANAMGWSTGGSKDFSPLERLTPGVQGAASLNTLKSLLMGQ
jgi:hypothetical protein